MKKISTMIMLMCILLLASHTFAFELYLNGDVYRGPIKAKYQNWDWGTLYAPGTVIDHGGAGSGKTNSWGLIKISQIFGKDINNQWAQVWSPTPTEALEGWFYGLSDDKVNLNGAGQGTIYTIGGKIDIYLGPQNMMESVGPTGANSIPGGMGWVPTDLYNATDGGLFLSGMFVPGIVIGDLTTTYAQQINSITNPLSGHGDGYVELTGGSAYSMFNSDMWLGGKADLLMASNFRGPGDYKWTANSDDPVLGAAVPEPTSILLIGIGALGLVTARKRRK